MRTKNKQYHMMMKIIIYIICAFILFSVISCDQGRDKTQSEASIDMSKVYYVPQVDIYIKIVWRDSRKDIRMYLSKRNTFPNVLKNEKEPFAYITFSDTRGLISELFLKKNCDTIYVRKDMSSSDLFQLSGEDIGSDTTPIPPHLEKIISNNVREVKPYDLKFQYVKYIDKNFLINKPGVKLELKDNIYILSFEHITDKENVYNLFLKNNSDTIKLEPL